MGYRMTRRLRYDLGRALAAARDAKLEYYGTPDGEAAYEREVEIGALIEEAGGWDADVQRGYDDARRDYAREREGR